MRSFKLDPSLQRSHTKMGAQPTVSRAVPTLGGGGYRKQHGCCISQDLRWARVAVVRSNFCAPGAQERKIRIQLQRDCITLALSIYEIHDDGIQQCAQN